MTTTETYTCAYMLLLFIHDAEVHRVYQRTHSLLHQNSHLFIFLFRHYVSFLWTTPYKTWRKKYGFGYSFDFLFCQVNSTIQQDVASFLHTFVQYFGKTYREKRGVWQY